MTASFPSPSPPSAFPPPSSAPIFRLETSGGRGGLAVFLLDGEGVLDRLEKIFHPRSKKRYRLFREQGDGGGKNHAKTSKLFLGRLANPVAAAEDGKDGETTTVDEVLAAPLPPRSSSTGYEQVELSCHGSAGVRAAVVEVLSAAGFREARPGEPETRAYRNGRSSLLELEASLRLGRAVTARQAELLLGAPLLREQWTTLAARLEAAGDTKKAATVLKQCAAAAREATRRAAAAAAVLRTHTVALVGPPNAGKSSLTNRLARAKLRLVDAAPGTTRDVQAVPLDLGGLAVRWIDTAGLTAPPPVNVSTTVNAHRPRSVPDEETRRRAARAAREADLVVMLLDGSRPPTTTEKEFLRGLLTEVRGPVLPVLNKADLPEHRTAAAFAGSSAKGKPVLFGEEEKARVPRISALTGTGIAELTRRTAYLLLGGEPPTPGAPFTQRQLARLRTAAELAERGKGTEAVKISAVLQKLTGCPPVEDELGKAWRELFEA